MNYSISDIVVRDKLNYSISVMLTDAKTRFCWRLVVVYGLPYEEGKQMFIDELHKVVAVWQGPTLIGCDFNLVGCGADKSNRVFNDIWAESFNAWIDSWGLIELNSNNRKFTWTNNQEQLIMARIDRIFATTSWEGNFPMCRVKALDRLPSDHTPLLLDSGDNIAVSKKTFRFEKWWLERRF